MSGGGREGGEGACGNETLITEPLLFPSIWDISYILKTLAVYIFKGSGERMNKYSPCSTQQTHMQSADFWGISNPKETAPVTPDTSE